MKSADRPRARSRDAARRATLIQTLGGEVVRFQDAANEVDDAAAAVLALERADLPCLSLLLYMGQASLERLGSMLRLSPRALAAMLERLELAGYARRVAVHDGARQVELTEHARRWIETLWGPIQQDGVRLMEAESTRDLEVLTRFMQSTTPVQTRHAARIRALLEVPSRGATKNRLRGGLSPAALRRVQLFVEANLARAIQLDDLAERAGLSAFHFARAFKTGVGMTPRSFVESRRIEKARTLLRGSELSLVEVALETGFGSQSRFTTTFRRATGFTPALYRRGKP
jgi:AraC family transcriptional regulator